MHDDHDNDRPFPSSTLKHTLKPNRSLLAQIHKYSTINHPTEDTLQFEFDNRIHQWLTRPCFEHRVHLYLPIHGHVVQFNISGSDKAVAELEFSDHLLLMATPLESQNPQPSIPPPPPPPPSPLRFSEESNKEDQIPLAYVLRIKKKREQKAREEHERRMFEQERRKQEQERAERERQRKLWEDENKRWQKEKERMEQERKARLYAQEIVAARQRRENARTGESPLKDRDRYSRPVYDISRQSTSLTVPRSHKSHSSSHSSSPGSSRPESLHSNSTPSSEDAPPPKKRPASRRVFTFPPPSPAAADDGPLLPPSPPFVKQQYHRNTLPRSSSASADIASQRRSSSSDTGHLNPINQPAFFTMPMPAPYFIQPSPWGVWPMPMHMIPTPTVNRPLPPTTTKPKRPTSSSGTTR
jgi:hypothetical protein